MNAMMDIVVDRPFVCDTTVSHHAVDEHNSRYDAIIEPWVENEP